MYHSHSLFLLCLLLSSISFVTTNAAESGLLLQEDPGLSSELVIREGTELPDVQPERGYPADISDVYKGQWIIDTNKTSSMESLTWSFEKFKGSFIFQIKQRRKESEALSSSNQVTGYLELRDGQYSTDEYMRYHMYGVYEQTAGKVELLGIPFELNDLDSDFHAEFMNATRLEVLEMYSLLDNMISMLDKDCFLHMHLRLLSYPDDDLKKIEARQNIEQQQRDGEEPLIYFNGSIDSRHCNFFLKLEGSPVIFSEYYGKALTYVIVVAVLTFVQIALLVKQLEFTSTTTAICKVSMLMIGMQAVLDSYVCLFHLTIGIFVEATLNAFVTVSFFTFILFSVFEMRYMLVIWKARRPQIFRDGWDAMQRQLGILYARLYASLILGFILIYIFSGYFHLFVFLIYSFWLPQIACNTIRDSRHALSRWYLFGTSISRLFIPLYFFLCPSNYLHIEPHPSHAWWLLLWVVVQVAFIQVQDSLGPRFFVPKQFLPKKYDYFRSYAVAEDQECAICMNSVIREDLGYMVTPCQHIYHTVCLEKWMEEKMICPVCRRDLPHP